MTTKIDNKILKKWIEKKKKYKRVIKKGEIFFPPPHLLPTKR